MKQILEKPIMVNIELSLIQDIVRIIGSAIHNRFSHDEIENVKQTLITKGQEAIKQTQAPIQEN